MIVVSDTSPLIAFAAVGHLDLLRNLYGEVVLPEAVHRELLAGGADAPGSASIDSAGWLQVRSLTDRSRAIALGTELDEGEAEAIALAVELGADLLLVDEHRGRMVAGRLGVRVAGVLGVLIEAKRGSLLTDVRPVLDALVTVAGFRVGEALYARVLEAAGE